MPFKRNIDRNGRLLRLAIAILLLVYAYWFQSWLGLFVGLFVLFEAAASWCVMYQLLGKNSCPIDKK